MSYMDRFLKHVADNLAACCAMHETTTPDINERMMSNGAYTWEDEFVEGKKSFSFMRRSNSNVSTSSRFSEPGSSRASSARHWDARHSPSPLSSNRGSRVPSPSLGSSTAVGSSSSRAAPKPRSENTSQEIVDPPALTGDTLLAASQTQALRAAATAAERNRLREERRQLRGGGRYPSRPLDKEADDPGEASLVKIKGVFPELTQRQLRVALAAAAGDADHAIQLILEVRKRNEAGSPALPRNAKVDGDQRRTNGGPPSPARTDERDALVREDIPTNRNQEGERREPDPESTQSRSKEREAPTKEASPSAATRSESEVVEELLALLPDCDPIYCRQVLRECGGDKSAAAQRLLDQPKLASLKNVPAKVAPPAAAEPAPSSAAEESDVMELLQILPESDKGYVRSVLRAAGGDKEIALHRLLEGPDRDPENGKDTPLRYDIFLNKKDNSSLGVDVNPASDFLGIEEIRPVGLIADWNDAHTESMVLPGDCIISVNGVSGDGTAMIKSLQSSQTLQLRLERGGFER